jgi:hypothetical protein
MIRTILLLLSLTSTVIAQLPVALPLAQPQALSTASPMGGVANPFRIPILDGGDEILAPPDALWNFGTGDITISTWLYITTPVNNASVFDFRTAANADFFVLYLDTGTGKTPPHRKRRIRHNNHNGRRVHRRTVDVCVGSVQRQRLRSLRRN